ncbi:hypothetical protein FVE85_3238 [Porphyridium purpureum]|uniref:Uncharacterized protein n=1 Tax=Porphyridium purpureum TaxID=35688 RepID=A0A5J4YX12_PORPP|nr:hypothetical protein FVE85_3238 [Porphyridium purpureum]|eukprot:POR6294..scf227_4
MAFVLGTLEPLGHSTIGREARCPIRMALEPSSSKNLGASVKSWSISGAAILAAVCMQCPVSVGVLHSLPASVLPAANAAPVGTCYFGEGDGCATLAGENELIRSLQEKSRLKKDEIVKEQRESWWARGYADYFKFGYDQDLVRSSDGSWVLKRTPSLLEKALGPSEKK